MSYVCGLIGFVDINNFPKENHLKNKMAFCVDLIVIRIPSTLTLLMNLTIVIPALQAFPQQYFPQCRYSSVGRAAHS